MKLTDHPSTYNDLTNFESEVSAQKERKRKLWQSVETCLEKTHQVENRSVLKGRKRKLFE